MEINNQPFTELPFEINDYYFFDKIGEGSFSKIYKVIDTRFKIEFAAKVVMCGDTDKNDNNIVWFNNEVNHLEELDHPNIMRIFKTFSHGPFNVMILTYCSGGTLMEHIENSFPFANGLLMSYICQMISALEHCHSHKIAHRDIKPDNILIDKYGRLILSDFGFSMKPRSSKLFSSFRGSFAFISPEMFSGVAYDPFKADVWALGVTIYVLAYGKLPWPIDRDEKTIKKAIINADITIPKESDPIVARLISSMLQIEPSIRPSMHDIAQCEDYQSIIAIKEATLPKLLQRNVSQLVTQSHGNLSIVPMSHRMGLNHRHYSQFEITRRNTSCIKNFKTSNSKSGL